MQINLPLIIHEMPPALDDPIWKKYRNPKYSALKYELSVRIYMRTRLAEAQNWHCCWCGCDATHLRGKSNSATVEHIIPRSKGGSDDMENLAMACERCNTRRGVTDIDVFMSGKGNPVGTKISTRESQRLARERRYRKRAIEFEKNGWKDSKGNQYSFSEWIKTLTRLMSAECRTELTEKYGNKDLAMC
jgi:hypothetical protein